MQKKYEEINFPMKRFFAGAAGTLCAAHLIYAARHGVWVTQNIYRYSSFTNKRAGVKSNSN